MTSLSLSERYRQRLRQQDEAIASELSVNPLTGRNRTAAPTRTIEESSSQLEYKAPLKTEVSSSPKVPRRKGSFDGGDDLSKSDHDADRSTLYVLPLKEESPASTPRVFSSSSTSRNRKSVVAGRARLCPGSPDVFHTDAIARSASTTLQQPGSAHWDSTETTKPCLSRPTALAAGFGGQQRNRTIGTSRPFMEITSGLRDSCRRAPWRGSIGRPCMDRYGGEAMAISDRPILRPYRQLSSDALCIGEDTDEDLSNRSHRSTTFNKSMDSLDFDFDFSVRSAVTADDVSIATFRTVDN